MYSTFEKGSKVWGDRNYELSNHLGNVLAVIKDMRIGKDINADGFDKLTTSTSVEVIEPIAVSAND